MPDEIIQQDTTLQPRGALAAAGEAANRAADASAFQRYQAARPDSTLQAQRNDLVRFAGFLHSVGVAAEADALYADPAAWAGITHGLVAAFVEWQVQEGYAIASINRALATIKKYVKLANGSVEPNERHAIANVPGIAYKDRRHVNERRTTTRRGHKKEQHTSISHDQARALKAHDLDTPQGRRDAVLMCLLIDHGLRESEAHDLRVTDIDMKRGLMTFHRRKTGTTQTLRMSRSTAQAMGAYLRYDAPLTGGLLRGSRKGGALTDSHMSISAIKQRVRQLGQQQGIDRLSPHDLRHYWATRAAERGVNPLRLQEAGGWSSLEMPRRYVEQSKIANEGMNDDD